MCDDDYTNVAGVCTTKISNCEIADGGVCQKCDKGYYLNISTCTEDELSGVGIVIGQVVVFLMTFMNLF